MRRILGTIVAGVLLTILPAQAALAAPSWWVQGTYNSYESCKTAEAFWIGRRGVWDTHCGFIAGSPKHNLYVLR